MCSAAQLQHRSLLCKLLTKFTLQGKEKETDEEDDAAFVPVSISKNLYQESAKFAHDKNQNRIRARRSGFHLCTQLRLKSSPTNAWFHFRPLFGRWLKLKDVGVNVVVVSFHCHAPSSLPGWEGLRPYRSDALPSRRGLCAETVFTCSGIMDNMDCHICRKKLAVIWPRHLFGNFCENRRETAVDADEYRTGITPLAAKVLSSGSHSPPPSRRNSIVSCLSDAGRPRQDSQASSQVQAG